jgi:2-polyprenyl-6-methoxyphenol hydroxylase-like FAD-dependent oxidoreductase
MINMPADNSNRTQVVIIGGGPTGLSLAAQLIRYGIDFIIIEKNERTTHLSKAIAVQARTLEIFKELGIVEEAIKRGQITTGMHLFYKGKQKAGIDLVSFGEGISEFAMALSLEQSKTETLLLEYIMQHGKNVQWKSQLSHFEQHEDGVHVFYKDGNGNDQKIESDYIVGCDGAGSVVRHQLNFSFEGSTEPKLFYVADVVLSSSVINKNALYMYMIPKGFILFFPMEGTGHYRIIGILPDQKDNEYTFADIEPTIVEQIISPVTFKELNWFSTYRVHSRMANSFMDGRCFIAGDAGHIHTPAGGQGMNTGIQDAYNLAWKIALTLKGEVNDEVLKTYNTERTENAKHLLQTTDRMFDIMSGINRFWNSIRLAFFPLFLSAISKSRFARRNVFPLLSQTGIAYPGSFLTQKSSIGKIKAGDRMHYFVFANGKNIFDYLTQPNFKLLYFGNNTIENPLQGQKLKIDFHSFTEIPKAIFGNENSFYILLRPDNHISYIGQDLQSCKNIIKKIQ